jgi:hypothetical protein
LYLVIGLWYNSIFNMSTRNMKTHTRPFTLHCILLLVNGIILYSICPSETWQTYTHRSTLQYMLLLALWYNCRIV